MSQIKMNKSGKRKYKYEIYFHNLSSKQTFIHNYNNLLFVLVLFCSGVSLASNSGQTFLLDEGMFLASIPLILLVFGKFWRLFAKLVKKDSSSWFGLPTMFVNVFTNLKSLITRWVFPIMSNSRMFRKGKVPFSTAWTKALALGFRFW